MEEYRYCDSGRQAYLGEYLSRCLSAHRSNWEGAPASYIPELAKANPDHFGIALATLDGHVYEVGDSDVPFTIQSISKAFVFSLALEVAGHKRVEATVGVEPSGEAFNSIRLSSDNRPYNPMINAGAIACSGLLYDVLGKDAFPHILAALGRFAGRTLEFNERVFLSERNTGDRNRAIAYLLRNYEIIKSDVTEVLDVYFRQCSILVTARDLALMAATLANRGVNPLTQERVASEYAVARTLSMMTSCGMYDYSGEWIYRIGLPAKSGVGGGIMAALPGQFGLGTFSPLLDSHGNSVRGIKVCEALSSQFALHMLSRSNDVSTAVIADYNLKGISSRRMRQPQEERVLDEHHNEVRVLELVGSLTFAHADFISRHIAKHEFPSFLLLDFRRVPGASEGAIRLIGETVQRFTRGNTTVVFSGLETKSTIWASLFAAVDRSGFRRFDLLDDAIEWAEDQIMYRYLGLAHIEREATLRDQVLLAGLQDPELLALASYCTERTYPTGERIIAYGELASSLFFVQSGLVSIKLPDGVRLASLSYGMVFGEMALLEPTRSADVWADTRVFCLELTKASFDLFSREHPLACNIILKNLAFVLAKRLVQANAKIDVLSAY